MTDADLSDIERKHAEMADDDAEWLTCRPLVPALVAEVRKLKALLGQYQWAAESDDGNGGRGSPMCPVCWNGEDQGHEPLCGIAEAIK